MYNGLKSHRLFYISAVMGMTPSSIFAHQDMVSQPVRIFVVGDNTWQDEQEWPIARAQYTKYYLHGKLMHLLSITAHSRVRTDKIQFQIPTKAHGVPCT